MRALPLILLLSSPAFGAIQGLSSVGATSGQIVISYTAPSLDSCKVEVSTDSAYGVVEKDVDATLYSNQDRDLSRASTISVGRHRIVVLGRIGFENGLPAVEEASNGYHLSRALRADTPYYIRVSDCGDGDSQTLTVRTTNIPLGDSRGMGLAAHPTDRWRYLQSTQNPTQNREFADPYTGALIKNPPELRGFAYAQSTETSGDGYTPSGCNVTLGGVNGSCTFTAAVSSTWTATSGTVTDAIAADDNNFAEYSGTAQDKLWLRLGSNKNPVNSTTGQTLSFQNLHFSAKTSDATGEGGWMRVCITGNGVDCISPPRRVTLTESEAVYSVCGDDPCTKDNPGDFMVDYFPSIVPGKSRVYNVSGNLTALKFSGPDALEACNDTFAGEYLQIYDSRTNAISPYVIQVSSTTCGASPPEATIPGGYDLAHNGTKGVTFWRNDGIGGPRYGALIWKESVTSTSTISVDLPLWRAASSMPYKLAFGSGGFGKRCQNVPNANGYYPCMTGVFENVIIGVKPLESGGLDIVNYGLAHWRGDLINAGLTSTSYPAQTSAGNDAPWDDEDSGVFYTKFDSTAACGGVFVKMTLSFSTTTVANPDPDGTYPYGTRAKTAGLSSTSILTPCGSGASDFSLNTQRGRISSEWLSKGSMFSQCSIEGVQGKTLIEICRAGEQDSHGFVFAYDLGNKLPAGAGFVGTRGGNTQQAFGGFLVPANHESRFCGVHTYQNPMTLEGSPFALIELGSKGPHSVTVTTALSACNSRATPGTCSTCPAVTVDGFDYTGKSWCDTIDVTSSCSAVGAPAECVDGDPVTSGAAESPNLKWYQGFAVGDVIQRNGELLKLLKKNTTTQWEVLRGWGYQSSDNSSDIYAPQTHSGGLTWSTWCGGQSKNPLVTNPESPWGLAWYFGDDPNGTISSYTFLNRFQNHGFHFVNYGVFPDYTINRFDLSDPISNAASISNGSFIQLHTTYGGKLTQSSNSSSNCSGNGCEKHPGANQVRGDPSWFSDVNPRMFHPSGTNGATLVSGSTYTYQYSGVAIISPKHFDIVGYMGRWPFRRVDTLTDDPADTGKMCIAIAANDCFSGSTAGKVYFVNSVFDTTFMPLSTCRESQFGTTNGDACFGPEVGMGATISQWGVPDSNGISVLNGRKTRAVSREWRSYREAATENVKTDPTGKALLARNMWYVAVPPFPKGDSRNRGTFTPVPVNISGVPPSTDNVLVQFGHNPSFQCSRNRDNTCYAESATLNEATPFQFDHETLTGLSCASGCTVTVPAISNRVLYYRIIYRDAGDNVILTGKTRVKAIN